jgi:hypothetical protein
MATTATDIQKKTEHRRLFEERLAAELEAKKYNSPYLGEEEYDKVKSVVGSWDTLSKEEKKALGSKAYAWKSKYAVVGDGENALLIYASSGAAGDDDKEEQDNAAGAQAPMAASGAALDQAVMVSHGGRMFEDLFAVHEAGGHCKARTFEARLKAKFGKSIPRWVVRLPAALCLVSSRHFGRPFCRMGAHSAEWYCHSAEWARMRAHSAEWS